MKTITVNPKEVFALDSDIRRKIIDLLDTERSVPDLMFFIKNYAITTIRHHVSILLNAGLIRKTRMVEIGGAYTKYYKSNVKLVVKQNGRSVKH